MAIFFNFPPTLNQLHPLQVENCDSSSQLAVDENDNSKFRLERVKYQFAILVFIYKLFEDPYYVLLYIFLITCTDKKKELSLKLTLNFWPLKTALERASSLLYISMRR